MDENENDLDESQFGMVDLTGVSLDDLMELPKSAFAHSLSRIIDEIDGPQNAAAGWNSAI